MSKRKGISKTLEVEVLYQSGRRCCACFGLTGDFRQKQGQIAHLDQNNQNNKFENLVFLCLEHHDQYDSKSSQSKGLSIGEIKRYRDSLYEAIEERRAHFWPASTKSTFNMLIDEIEFIKSVLAEYKENVNLLREQAYSYGPGAVPAEIQKRLSYEKGLVRTLEDRLEKLNAEQNTNQNGVRKLVQEDSSNLSSLNILIIDTDPHWQEIYAEMARALECRTAIISPQDMLSHVRHLATDSHQLAIIGIPSPEDISDFSPYGRWVYAINKISQIMPIIFMIDNNALPVSTFYQVSTSSDSKGVIAVIQKETFSSEWFTKMLRRALFQNHTVSTANV